MERTRSLEWINCGHTSPLLARVSGVVEPLDASATVVGMFPDWTGEVHKTTLEAGDTLLIYSDGLTEAANGEDEEFGLDRLLSFWTQLRKLNVRDQVHSLARGIREHSRGILCDDLTIMALRGRA